VLRLGVLFASLALVGAACSADGPSDEARASSRSSSTTSLGLTPTTMLTPPPSTTTSPPAETTTAPPAATSPAPEPVPVPVPARAPASPPANGQLPDASLTTVTPSCRILNDLAPRLRSLLDAAHADGIALWPETQPYTTGAMPPRLTSCYRDLDLQQWWLDYYCGQGSCGMAAVPGTSVHGWGRAVDFEEGGQELAFDMNGYQWLVGHAAAFGFVQPGWAGPSGTAPEPWHWEAS
jgi:hypothetical protein